MSHIVIHPSKALWLVHAAGAQIARSNAAVELAEGSYGPVPYLPCADVAMELLERSAKQTTCPFKGIASYFHIVTPAGRLENAVWSYEAPKQSVVAIAGHLAFYPNLVAISRG